MMADVVGGGMRSCYVLGMSLVHELLDVCFDPCNIDGWSACIRFFPSPAGKDETSLFAAFLTEEKPYQSTKIILQTKFYF